MTLVTGGTGDVVSAQEAVANACNQLELPGSYDADLIVNISEQGIFEADGYVEHRSEHEMSYELYANLRVDGKDYHGIWTDGSYPDAPPYEMLSLDGVVYEKEGPEWSVYEHETGEPSGLIPKCADMTDFIDLGKEEVGEVTATRYAAAPLLLRKPMVKEELHEFWLDGDNVLVQYRITHKGQSLVTQQGERIYEGEITNVSLYVFSGFGEANEISAPTVP